MKKVKLGIIGVGVQGSSYADFLLDKTGATHYMPQNITVGALCDIDSNVKEKCGQRYPEVPFFSDYKEMIASGCIDAIVTTVPHYFHTEMAIYALEHNIHVLGEKPAGVYTKAVRQMNACAAKHPSLTFAIMFNQRTNKLYRQLKELVASGELGEIRRANWIINSWWRPDSYYRQSEWRATWGGEGGGVVVNQAPHQLDLFQWICGMPKKVYSKIIYGAHRDIVVDNDVTSVFEFENGATGVLITCTHDIAGTDRLEIDLDKGKIVVEDSKKATILRFNKSETEMNATMTMQDVKNLTKSNSADGNAMYKIEVLENTDGWGMQHLKVLENFAANILEGEKLIAPGADGINGVQLANAILLSAWLGKEVEIPVDEDLYIAQLNEQIKKEGKFKQQ